MMKYLYLVLLSSLFVISCGKSSKDYESEYSELYKRFEERTKEKNELERIIDSLKNNGNNSKNKLFKPQKDNLMDEDFFKNFDYANYVKIIPATYFVKTFKNNINKNYICQLLKSVDGSNSKYIFIPTNKTIFDVYINYNPEKTTKSVFDELFE